MTVAAMLVTAILALCAGIAGYLLGARRSARPTASIAEHPPATAAAPRC